MPRRTPAPEPRGRGGKRGRHNSPGAGSVFQVSPTRWRGAFTWHDPLTGASTRVHLSAPDRAAVLKAWEDRRRQLGRGHSPADALQSVDSYLTQWLTNVVRVESRPRTYETYLDHCRRISGAIGQHRLCDLRPEHVERFYAELGATKAQRGDRVLSVATVRLTHTVLHSALSHAVRRRLIDSNPADHVALPRQERREYTSLTPDEVIAILRYARESGDRLLALWVLVAATGLRRSEALGVRWQDLDLGHGLLTVRQQLVRTRDGLIPSEPKSARGRRPIPLPRAALAALAEHRERMDAERRPDWPAGDLVFLTKSGGGYNGKTIDTHWRRMLARAGLPHVRLHDLRHTFASLLTGEGVPMRTVAGLLGHSQIGVTMDVYSHLLPAHAEGAVAHLERLLWPDSAPVVPPVVPSAAEEGAG